MYTDPGALSYLVQILMAGVLAVLFWCRSLREKLIGLFRKKKEDKNKEGL